MITAAQRAGAIAEEHRPPTIAEALSRASLRLTAAGCQTPLLDAELLLAHALGCDRAALIIDARRSLQTSAEQAFDALLRRRVAREPVAYILRRRAFRRIELAVDRRALIPRPESELLVEVGLTLPAAARVLDVGTGCGAIALALADERADLQIAATDSSPAAIALARENAAALGLARVDFHVADLRAGLPCDALLANLPYVEEGARLEAEITRYEPASALFGGTDGLEVIRRLCAQLDGVRVAALEHGAQQGSAVRQLLGAAGYARVQTLRDLAGHERVTVARR
jgi:release factor glutamine methyltransferase